MGAVIMAVSQIMFITAACLRRNQLSATRYFTFNNHVISLELE